MSFVARASHDQSAQALLRMDGSNLHNQGYLQGIEILDATVGNNFDDVTVICEHILKHPTQCAPQECCRVILNLLS